MRIIFFGLLSALIATFANAKNGSIDISKGNIQHTELNVDVMAYVEANVLATFYHEIGHALIDKMELPVFAREEDAADTFAVVLTDILHSSEKSELIAWASADQYLQLNHRYRNSDPNYSDVHSPDLVRFYNTLCLYYGSDPDLRSDFAEENGLPEDRAITCEEERHLAERSWRGVLSKIIRTPDKSDKFDWLVIDEIAESNNQYVIASRKVLQDAVADLNERYAPDFKIRVRLTKCNEDNAFYDPYNSKILMCNELIPPLSRRVEGL